VRRPLSPAELLEGIDGLVLQGGSDMSPRHYGEEPLRPEWEGDPARDVYEIGAGPACAWPADKPLLGVCRGAQVLNVALGRDPLPGHRDAPPGARVHRNWEIYDEHAHEISSSAARCSSAGTPGTSPIAARGEQRHHQGLKTLGRGLVIEARSLPDGVVEAVRYEAPEGGRAFAYGVQWHPEFIRSPGLLDPQILLGAFSRR
jgi:putative glutamine amidotransferase